jgi:hypothetical protein
VTIEREFIDNKLSFATRFERCHHLLHCIASRLLTHEEQVEEAIRVLLGTAPGRAPIFKHEGELRSWLVRVLIDEALRVTPSASAALFPTTSPLAAAPPSPALVLGSIQSA